MENIEKGRLSEERRKEISQMVFDINPEELSKCNIQELLFAHFTTVHCKGKHKETDKEYAYFEAREKMFYNNIVSIVKNTDVIYTVYSTATNHPFVSQHGAWIFSEEGFANNCVMHMEENEGISLTVKAMDTEDFVLFCANLYRIGVSLIILDNGEINIQLKKTDFIPDPEPVTKEGATAPVINPELQYYLLNYCQLYDQSQKRKIDPRYIKITEAKICQIIKTAKFLLPVIVDKEVLEQAAGNTTLPKGTNVQFPVLTQEDMGNYIPLYTDINEYNSGTLDIGKYTTAIYPYEVLKNMNIKNAAGFVINPFGVNMILTLDAFKELGTSKE